MEVFVKYMYARTTVNSTVGTDQMLYPPDDAHEWEYVETVPTVGVLPVISGNVGIPAYFLTVVWRCQVDVHSAQATEADG